jgi:O-phosphoseryl-tRNA(Cys) synthetase
MVDVVKVQATVDSIDAANRTVTFKLPNGMLRTVKAGPEVRNFDQIKPGDVATVRFLESVAIVVAKRGEQSAASETQTVKVAAKGEKPGAVIVNTMDITAVVEKIDYKKRLISLKGPEGNTREFPVDESVKKFTNIKKGDNVFLRFTEAVAITIDAPVTK